MDSIDIIVRNQINQRMGGFINEIKSIKQQVEAQSRVNRKNQDQISHLRKQIQIIKRQNHQLRQTINLNLQKQNQAINYSLTTNQRQIQHLTDIIKNIQQKQGHTDIPALDDHKTQYRTHNNSFLQLPNERQSFRKKSQKIFVYHLGNPHNERFRINCEFNKISIKYIKEWDGHCYNFIKNGQILSNQSSFFKIRQLKTSSKYVMIGIATSAIFGMKDAHRSKDCVAYFSANGNVWNMGICGAGGRMVGDGQVLGVNVDTSSWIVTWVIGMQTLAIAQIPEGMRGKGLYLVVMLVHQYDQIQVLLD